MMDFDSGLLIEATIYLSLKMAAGVECQLLAVCWIFGERK